MLALRTVPLDDMPSVVVREPSALQYAELADLLASRGELATAKAQVEIMAQVVAWFVTVDGQAMTVESAQALPFAALKRMSEAALELAGLLEGGEKLEVAPPGEG